MTRRERLERKAERRREWAEKRDAKADGLRDQTPDSLRHDWAFVTQPGHIPERARMNRRDERANEHGQVAEHHRQKADGLESQLDRTVFSDDTDAVERLAERIASNERKRDAMKLVNRLYKKGDVSGLKKLGLSLEHLKEKMAALPAYEKSPYPAYALTNLGARIRTDKKRVEEIKRVQARTEKAESAGGVLIEEHGEYSWVTFAEKPSRAILDSLRAAGFHWGGGQWMGKTANLPKEVTGDLEAAVEADVDVAEVSCPECDDASVTRRHGEES